MGERESRLDVRGRELDTRAERLRKKQAHLAAWEHRILTQQMSERQIRGDKDEGGSQRAVPVRVRPQVQALPRPDRPPITVPDMDRMYLDLDGWVERDTLGRGRDVRRRLSGDGSTRRCAVLRRLFLLSLAAALVAGACTQGDDAATGETTSTAAAVATTKATPTTVASSTAVDGQSGVVVEKDLVFGSYNGVAMTLDLYLPAEPSGTPIVVEPPFPDDLAEAGAIVVGNVEGVGDPPDADDEGRGSWAITVRTFGLRPKRLRVRFALPGGGRPNWGVTTRSWWLPGSASRVV